MSTTYYAVANIGGPVSVKLEGETLEQAKEYFATLDPNSETDVEDDVLEEGDYAALDENGFAEVLREHGLRLVGDLAEVVNGHTGAVNHVEGGWTIWAHDDESTWTAFIEGDGEGEARDFAAESADDAAKKCAKRGAFEPDDDGGAGSCAVWVWPAGDRVGARRIVVKLPA